MDELIISTNIENNNLVSSFSAPKKIEKYFRTSSLFINYDEKNTVIRKLSGLVFTDSHDNENMDLDSVCYKITEKIFSPCALSIALHDRELWQKL